MDNVLNLETIVSLAKRRGFIYPGSEIYGGLSGTWDYGPLGVSLKRKVENLWWDYFVESRDNMYGLDSAILMNPKVWQASGHTETFNDPLIEDKVNKKRYRLDHLLEDNGIKVDNLNLEQMVKLVEEHNIKSPDGNELGSAAQFNQMIKAYLGSTEDALDMVYLRPETAQGMFVNFKNIVDSFYPDLPFGIAQVGKSFRNEISPRDFVFRSRELHIMEFEYFIPPETWEEEFDKLLEIQKIWYEEILGLTASKVHLKEIAEADRAHYSKRTIDFEYDFPFGRNEIGGFAYRGDFDLVNHQKISTKSMEYMVKGSDKKFIPHVLEPTFGLDRNILAVLFDSYRVDEVNSEKRVYLKLSKKLAPYIAAVSPLLKNKPELVTLARSIHADLKKKYLNVDFDDNGNIGKRYRRQDEIGTPYCITVDFDSLKNNTVTIRNRDTTLQEIVKIDQIEDYINKD